MADKVYRQDQGVERSMQTRYRDMGDGTHAQVIAAVLDAATTIVSLGDSTSHIGAVTLDVGFNPIGSVTVDPSENHIGQVGSHGTTISQTPTITAGAYGANDAVGGLLTFADAARLEQGGGVVFSLVIVDDAQQDAALELWLFDQPFTPVADNAPWDPIEAELESLVGVVTTADGAWYDSADEGIAVVKCAGLRYDLLHTTLYGQLVTRGTPTYAATDDITVKLGLLLD